MSMEQIAEFIIYALAGLVAGLVYFSVLYRVVQMHVSGDRPAIAILLHFGRLALAVGAFLGIAMQGALPLLAALIGFLAGRYAVTHWVKVQA